MYHPSGRVARTRDGVLTVGRRIVEHAAPNPWTGEVAKTVRANEKVTRRAYEAAKRSVVSK